MALGDWLRQERERRGGKSLRDMAALTGLSHTTLDDIEKNPNYDPGLSTVIQLADKLGVPRWQMLEHAGYPSGREQSPPLTPDELDRAVEAVIDLMAGASPAALDALTKLGLNLEEVLAAEWARD